MKSFTERNPKMIGLVVLAVMTVIVLGVIFLNRSVFASGYNVTARFPNAAGIDKGTDVLVAGVKVGSVTSVTVHGNAVDAAMTIDHSVQLPHHTTAAVQVETLLGVVDVTLDPVSGWSDPLRGGTLITDTSVPTEFYQLQNTAGNLLNHSDTVALNNVVQSLAAITKGKRQQVSQIIAGLGALTTTVDNRSGQVGQLIDSANTLSTTLASRDQQLTSVIDNLNTVAGGLAAHSGDLASLITNLDQVAGQTNSLVAGEKPQLDTTLASLNADLSVVGQHQEDLAEGVSYLGGALKGFASIAYSGTTPLSWANIYANVVTAAGGYGVIGPCGALDDALDQVLGPDPLPCAAQTGPLPGTAPAAQSGSAGGTASGTAATTAAGAAGGPKGTAGASATPPGGAAPSSGVGGLGQLLGPLLGGGK